MDGDSVAPKTPGAECCFKMLCFVPFVSTTCGDPCRVCARSAERPFRTLIRLVPGGSLVGATDFVYEMRGRLVIERRTGQDGYRFDYTYDLGGNRLTKVGDGKRTVYHYDIHDPCRYESNNNRLEYYEVWDKVPEPDELVSTTYYYYTGKGNVERVVAGSPDATI
jgi:hypothetical protein